MRKQPTLDEDGVLTIYFPTPTYIKCPVRSCNRAYMSTDWSTMKGSLKRHIKEDHRLVIPASRNMCTQCDNVIGKRPLLHACVRINDIYQVPSPPTPADHRCEICRARFTTKKGLNNHTAAHERKRRIEEAQRAVPFPTPNTKAERRRRLALINGQQADSSSSGTSSVPQSPQIQEPLTPPQNERLSDSESSPSSTSTQSGDNTEDSFIGSAGLNLSSSTNEDQIQPRAGNSETQAPTPQVQTAIPDNQPRIAHGEEPIASTSVRADQPETTAPHTNTNDLTGDNNGSPENPPHAMGQEQDQQGNTIIEEVPALHNLTQSIKDINSARCSELLWVRFERTLDEATSNIHRIVRIPDRTQARNNVQENVQDPENSSYIQKLYKRNRRQAMRSILGDKSERCSVEKNQVRQHFADTWTDRQFDENLYTPVDEQEEINNDPFTPREIRERLRKAENTAPGRDRITYNHWRAVDPDCTFLNEVFNCCKKYKRIPATWKDTVTVLIHKKGDKQLVENWRPIALCNTIYKLYTGCWATRLTKWLDDNKILSSAQKGFMPFDGVIEHNYIMNSLMREARKSRSELCIAWVDLTNAFGSIPHAAISRALECAGAGHDFVEIITNIYEDNSTTIITEDGPTDPIQIKSGIKQGCPISGLLFNIAIDPIIRKLQDDINDKHNVLAYADDLALIATSPGELQLKIDRAVEEANRISIQINTDKSATLHLSGKTPVGARPTQFTATGTPLRILLDGEAIQFLGCPVGYNILSNRTNLREIMDTGLKILTSKLTPWQRLDAIRTFFYPALNFSMRSGQYTKTEWDLVDRLIRAELKKTLSLPQEATNDFLHGSRKSGACGLPIAAEESDFALIDSAYKLLTSQDPITQQDAKKELNRTVLKRLRRAGDDADRGQFLSGSTAGDFTFGSNEVKNNWTTARQASKRQQIQWSFEDEEPTIICGDKTLKTGQRKAVLKTIRDLKQKSRDRRLKERPNQGKVMECVSACKESSHFLYTGEYTRFKDWRFIHKARLNLVPLNGAKPWITRPQEKRCRRCGTHDETLAHVICHCMRQAEGFQLRHNNIVSRIKAAAQAKHEVISENQAIAGTRLRPDLVITKNQRATIIDITIPFDNRLEAFQAAREEKLNKYAPIRTALLADYTQVDIEVVIVGALGSWDPANNRLIARLCSRRYAKRLRQLCVSDTIRWSRDIYMGHLTGEKEYTRPGGGVRNRAQQDEEARQDEDAELERPVHQETAPGSQDATPAATLGRENEDDARVPDEAPDPLEF